MGRTEVFAAGNRAWPLSGDLDVGRFSSGGRACHGQNTETNPNPLIQQTNRQSVTNRVRNMHAGPL
jgi:hypothetical protein